MDGILSPNMLKTYELCPKKFCFKYIKGISMPVDDTVFETGKNIHALASYYLRKENIDKLELYAKSLQERVDGVPAFASNILSTIDLIVSDNDLLSNLAYYLSDMPFYPNMRTCSILKPVRIIGLPYPPHDAYADYLFPEENEMRNVFFPAMFASLFELRKRNQYNHQPIIDHKD